MYKFALLWGNSSIFGKIVAISKFKAKDFEINGALLCLGNVSIDFLVDSMKKTGLCWFVCNFLFDYDSTDVDYILDIHRY